MRARRKKHGAERIAACSSILITDLSRLKENASYAFPEEKSELYLEIGCGKGDFAVATSEKNPQANYIAMERVADVMVTALEKAMAAKTDDTPDNLRFLINDAKYLPDILPPHCLDIIFINFCDPWPKKGYAKRRLTSTGFLDIYKGLLKQDGRILFKTDNAELFAFSMETFREKQLDIVWSTEDLHSSERAVDNIMTEYERNFTEKGFKVCSAEVKFRNE